MIFITQSSSPFSSIVAKCYLLDLLSISYDFKSSV